MTTAALSSKHQITIPAAVRRQLGLRQGDRLAFTPDETGGFHVRKAAGFRSDGYAKKFLRPPAGAVTDRTTASRLAAAAAYVRRNG